MTSSGPVAAVIDGLLFGAVLVGDAGRTHDSSPRAAMGQEAGRRSVKVPTAVRFIMPVQPSHLMR
jgi:hypothetical protein